MKPGIIFNKVSTTTLWQSSKSLFTKYLRNYEKLWQLWRILNLNFNTEALQFCRPLHHVTLQLHELIWKLFHGVLFLSLCRWSPHQSSSTGQDSLAATNWMDSQEWNSHHDIPRSIHGKTGQCRNHYQKLDCMLQLDSYYILPPLYPLKWYCIDFHNITGSRWSGLEGGRCHLNPVGLKFILVWKSRPGEPQAKHPVHGPGLKSKQWGLQQVLRDIHFLNP